MVFQIGYIYLYKCRLPHQLAPDGRYTPVQSVSVYYFMGMKNKLLLRKLVLLYLQAAQGGLSEQQLPLDVLHLLLALL